MTERVIDTNGWFEVPNNPISKAGVFQYMGKSIPGADPGKIYNVLRPPEELGSEETLASLRLIPWIDDHAMLGEVPNGIPAEEKGVQGVTGEQHDFDGETLFANIKLFSKALADDVESGKKELSLGYRCKYEYAPGVYNGMPYDYVQRQIRANHLASVDDGRMGPEVSVQDSISLTFDEKEIQMADPENKDGGAPAVESMTVEQAVAAVSQVMPLLQKLMSLAGASGAPASGDPVDATTTTAGEDEEETEEEKAKRLAAAGGAAVGTATDMEPDDKDKAAAAMDARISKLERLQAAMSPAAMAGAIAKRDKLAVDLSHHVGTFDHSAMSEQAIAEYGIKKLNLQAAKGSESAVLQGYLQAVVAPGKARTVPGVANAMDSRDGGGAPASFLSNYIAGK